MKTAAPQAKFLQICKEKDGKMAPQAKILQSCIVKWLSQLNFADIGGNPPLPNNPRGVRLITKIMIFRTKYKNLGQFMIFFPFSEFLGHFMIFMTNGRPGIIT